MNQTEMTKEVSKTVMIEKSSVDGKVSATVTTDVDGISDTQTFEGTEEEVQAKIDALK
jgi:K(+)-stimulated pyrophosphate-energized sodium pump